MITPAKRFNNRLREEAEKSLRAQEYMARLAAAGKEHGKDLKFDVLVIDLPPELSSPASKILVPGRDREQDFRAAWVALDAEFDCHLRAIPQVVFKR